MNLSRMGLRPSPPNCDHCWLVGLRGHEELCGSGTLWRMPHCYGACGSTHVALAQLCCLVGCGALLPETVMFPNKAVWPSVERAGLVAASSVVLRGCGGDPPCCAAVGLMRPQRIDSEPCCSWSFRGCGVPLLQWSCVVDGG